jgi:hypothetical protein
MSQIKKEIKGIKKNLKAIKKEAKKSVGLIDNIQQIIAEEEESMTAQRVFDLVEPFRYKGMADINFDVAKEDYNRTCLLYEETKSKALQLKEEAKAIEESIRAGNHGEEMFDKYYETMRDAHNTFGMEIALLNRKAASAVNFWDKCKRSYPAETVQH